MLGCEPQKLDAFGRFARLPTEIVTQHIVLKVLAQGPGAVDAFSQTCSAAYHHVADAAKHTLVAWSTQTLNNNPLLRAERPTPSRPPDPFVVMNAMRFLERITVQDPLVYGHAALKRNRFSEAADYFKEALGRQQGLFGVHALLLSALSAAGDTTQLAFWAHKALVPMCEQGDHASLLRFSLEAAAYDVALKTAADYLTTGPKARRACLFFDDLTTMPTLEDPVARQEQVKLYDQFLERLTRPSRAKHPPYANLFRYTAKRIAHKLQMGAGKEAQALAVRALRDGVAAEPHFYAMNQPRFSDLGEIALAAQRSDLALGYFERSLQQAHRLWDETLLVVKYLQLMPPGMGLTPTCENILLASLERVGLGARDGDQNTPILHASIPHLARQKGQPSLGVAYLRGRERSDATQGELSPAELVYHAYFLMQLGQPAAHVTHQLRAMQPEAWTAQERAAYDLAVQDTRHDTALAQPDGGENPGTHAIDL